MFKIERQDTETNARTGVLTTEHGIVETPAYVIVGTDGAVRCLEPVDLPKTKTQIIIANTYHLWRALGEEELNNYEGLHASMGWKGPLMTDSGGFQVFSMGFAREHGVGKIAHSGLENRRPLRSSGEMAPAARLDGSPTDVGETEPIETPRASQNQNTLKGESVVRVTDSGVYFMEGGEEQYLDAELSMRIQEQLGADIIFAFDEPSSPKHDHAYTKKAMERTHEWAQRSLNAKSSRQLLYGITQGGAFEDLRKESAAFINQLPFDGFAIGGSFGSSFGSTKDEMIKELAWTLPLLQADKPRHLLGIGRIEDLFRGVEAGIDTFDCVIPTREARHGALWTSRGRFDVTKGKYVGDPSPLDESCECEACETTTRGELYDLFKTRNMEAGRIATLHNVYFFNDLMEKIRNAIREGRFSDFKNEYLKNL